MNIRIIVPISEKLWRWTWDSNTRDDFRRDMREACFGMRPIVSIPSTADRYQVHVVVERSASTIEQRLKDVIAAWEIRCADVLDRIEGL